MDKKEIHQRIVLIEQTLEKTMVDNFYSGIAIIFMGIVGLLVGVVLFLIPLGYLQQVILLISSGIVAVFINTILTFLNAKKKQIIFFSRPKKIILFQTVIYFICLVTFAYVFQEKSFLFISSVLLLYGLLINSIRLFVVEEINYLGKISILAGIIGLIIKAIAPYLAFLVLGLAHVVIGIIIRIKYVK